MRDIETLAIDVEYLRGRVDQLIDRVLALEEGVESMSNVKGQEESKPKKDYRFEVGQTVWYQGSSKIYKATIESLPTNNMSQYAIHFKDETIGWVTEHYAECYLQATREEALVKRLSNLLYAIKDDGQKATQLMQDIGSDTPDVVMLKDIRRVLRAIELYAEFASKLVPSAMEVVEMTRAARKDDENGGK